MAEPAPIDLIRSIERAMQIRGEAAVHRVGGSSMSYAELDARSAVVASFLARRVARGVPVLVFGHKSHDLLCALVGCLRAGNPYVPADEVLPDARVCAMAEASGCGLVLDFGEARSLQEKEAGRPVFTQADIDGEPATSPRQGWEKAPLAEELVYILFTSGSTGAPKGVQISRANLEDFLSWTVHSFGYAQGEPAGFLNQAPFHFDLSVYELYNALVTGGTILSITKEDLADPSRLLTTLRRFSFELRVWVSTPSFLGYALNAADCDQALLPALREIVVIGEVLPVPVARESLRRLPKARLLNFYGPTEATVAQTVFEVTDAVLDRYPEIPIGRSKPGSEVILDEGEIVLAGPNVSRGYVNAPELTARRFSGPDGRRSYRTGDLGRVDETGLLFYAGRIDNQIKLNGYRIELEDIEAQLLRVPGVRAACVVTVGEREKVEWIRAFVVVDPSLKALDERGFRHKMKSDLALFLPAYMVPKAFARIDYIPMTPNGKADRAALGRMP